jgi:integrase
LNKSENQVRLWKNPRKKAVANFKLVVGDKTLDEITRDDMLDFREWWMERVAGEEDLKPGTANKDFTHLGQVLRKIVELKRLGVDMDSLLAGLSFAEGEQRTRPPFSSDWIKTKLLAPKALAGLNTEARAIVLVMVNTGARPSEISTLNESTIDLTAPVPHIKIRPDGRTVKSPRAKRDIPLLGVSLEAAKACPKGFPRYFDKPGLSGTVNAYFSENGLRETPEHSFYSLRHSFEDRMLEAGIDYRIRKDLMGHRLNGETYGKGASLDQAAALLRPISF